MSRLQNLEYMIEDLEKSIESRRKERIDLERTSYMLNKEEGGQSFAFQIWLYGDRKHIDNHFRELGYENPDDLVESLKNMNGEKAERSLRHEIKGLKHSMEEIYEELESDYCF